MSRKEFLDQLAYLLQDIAPEERDDAIGYYVDYFEEAGPEREQQVIEELGSPEKVAAMIRDSLNGKKNIQKTDITTRDMMRTRRCLRRQRKNRDFISKETGTGISFLLC